MTRRIIPLIMCGGAGTRLWPASREVRPKQFLPLFGTRSTFQDTLLRVSDADLFARPIIITNAAYRFMVLEQLAEIGIEADVLLEPMRRDSGPAIVAGAAFAQTRDQDAVVLALAADHVVRDSAAFLAACRAGLAAAETGLIVTFGINPERAATEYGYISPGAPVSGDVRAVAKFVEKPDQPTAERYIREGYLWNSGNFMFRAGVLLDEYRKSDAGSVQTVTDSVTKAGRDLSFIILESDAFAAAKPISIDYAVMEKTERAAVAPVSCGWSDVGSWHAVWELSDKDEQGNAARGTAVFEDSRNCNVVTDKALVALEGVDDLVVVAAQDAVLVSRQRDANGLKRLVAKLKTVAPEVTEAHIKVHRPWGSYQSVDNGERHQVKRIVVKPGQRLSLQRHYHRSEHWIVVRGAARVTVNETVKTVHENESIYIPMGAVHRLENPGKILLELIEVQTGSYLGEDDIIRLEDDYRRE
ncbi:MULTISPECIES: mannose-1-phosphate guanylyltransferase/mannose-6-phosphate isomerase [Bradyrhizobium]|jgi:mannose-1-phosphate guanylyltransferase/mannose-6-phosphate isomerase|uniref:mannose-1-phosphate guanylyltransferase n=1 Tax=Bradyrhizobium denitrificans TaxID=2734912 RepID=A0ABS5GHX5_9BRAD|nr:MULTISPECIES: mannose-1-phosphate guanylyltransferase/mannose-6-phosphate isomerase [Bradyrhizobium]ABQ37578.1 mannose-6-phosphate isomerase, type 2 [Bradyrhizobium sp. BTAi1]MBR1140942.1 mannose-1-phosphate guanylyltransferase/mannose-6-phosphate isomerase [Bradyrhizobium denitrificans]MDU0954333.1 mannose-1-phosphate guanylyltransferase/mannose-6-phosphate isomerase [Bradyrhizobium sp.]MDU1495584.1 mannose-1-phosphate guanylyltransferase/mannose-6-phosphate isomerase [Bradyrhizobium sp.]M